MRYLQEGKSKRNAYSLFSVIVACWCEKAVAKLTIQFLLSIKTDGLQNVENRNIVLQAIDRERNFTF